MSNNAIGIPEVKPIEIDLSTPEGFKMRQMANEEVENNWEKKYRKLQRKKRTGRTTGLDEGKIKLQMKIGILVEMVIRNRVGLPIVRTEEEQFDPKRGGLAQDLYNENKVLMDIKTEGADLEFALQYPRMVDGKDDGIPRESKHNFFVRQFYNPKLIATDIFIICRVRSPAKKNEEFPGTERQTKWKMWICGWTSKVRAIKQGVLIPRGGLSERGESGIMSYIDDEIEFYQHALNEIKDLNIWFHGITKEDVIKDEKRDKDEIAQLTLADGQRVLGSALHRGFITKEEFEANNDFLGLTDKFAAPHLHENHTIRFIQHLVKIGRLPESTLEKMKEGGIVELTADDIPALASQFFKPNQVKNTKIKRKSATEMEVSWSKPEPNIIPEGAPDKLVSNVNNILYYKITRLDGQEWVVLEPECKATTYTDTGLEENKEYFYRVSAINAIGEGKPFPNVPDKIDDVTAIKSGTKVNVSWKAPNDNGFDIKEYKIERSEVKYTLKTNRETISDVKDTEYQDTVPKEDEEYFYRVSAINAIGEGELSKANNPAINEDDS